jgi:sterol desaturase/sphingolipid hydroxylase (fatty acid hydroxylase superfamily)
MTDFLSRIGLELTQSVEKLFWLSVVFAILAIAVKGRRAIDDARKASGDTRVNLVWYLTDVALITPPMIVLATVTDDVFSALGAYFITPSSWDTVHGGIALLAAIILSDFVGYWRHRWMHTKTFWPAHAVHHSDREMTWLALARFHPINRVMTTVLNMAVLAAFGLPVWAIIASGMIRNLYGFFVHADLPWNYGRAMGRIFVSPVLHRWHHAKNPEAAGKNFATIFAFFDVAFGTWYCPHNDAGALGIEDPGFPDSWWGQMVWPFRVWAGRLLPNRVYPVQP